MASRHVLGIVALCAAVAVGGIVSGTLLQSRGEHTSLPLRKGVPPLELPSSAALRLYDAGKLQQAGALYSRSHALADKIGAAFSRWPDGTLDTMKSLVSSHPGSSLAELQLGLAYYWSGDDTEAVLSWKAAAKAQPDSPYAVVALDFLHPDVAPGLPPIVVDAPAIAAPARQLLLRGVLAWDRERTVTARRLIDAAAKRAPADPAVLAAAAVALYSPATPKAPFPKLGPLSGAYPRASVVRLDLGVVLLWTRQVAKGKVQLRLAVSEQPGSVYARQATRILQALGPRGSK